MVNIKCLKQRITQRQYIYLHASQIHPLVLRTTTMLTLDSTFLHLDFFSLFPLGWLAQLACSASVNSLCRQWCFNFCLSIFQSASMIKITFLDTVHRFYKFQPFCTSLRSLNMSQAFSALAFSQFFVSYSAKFQNMCTYLSPLSGALASSLRLFNFNSTFSSWHDTSSITFIREPSLSRQVALVIDCFPQTLTLRQGPWM